MTTAGTDRRQPGLKPLHAGTRRAARLDSSHGAPANVVVGAMGGTWLLMTPAIGCSLILWSIVPTALTLWFAFQGYSLLTPPKGFVGFKNFYFLLTDPGLPRFSSTRCG